MALINYWQYQSQSDLFDEAMIQKIADLASALTPIGDIAVLLDIKEELLRYAINLHDSPVRKAYMRAKAETALKLRRQEIELAEVGSPMAAQMTSLYLRDMQQEEDL